MREKRELNMNELTAYNKFFREIIEMNVYKNYKQYDIKINRINYGENFI